MRFIPIFLVIFLFTHCSQEPSSTPPPGDVTISGTVKNSQLNNIIFIRDKEQRQALIDDGNFNLTFFLEDPTTYLVRYGNNNFQVYLEPGDNIQLTFDAQRINESLSFSGIGGGNNEYLNEQLALEREWAGKLNAAYRNTKEAFLNELQAAKEAYEMLFEKHRNDMSPYFRSVAENDITYELATRKLLYPEYYTYYHKSPPADVDETYYDFIDVLNLNDPFLLNSEEFKAFIKTYLDYVGNRVVAEDELTVSKKFQIIDSLFKDNKVSEFLQYDLLKEQFRYGGISSIKELAEKFIDNAENPAYTTEIRSLYEKWESLLPGKPAPNFEAVTHDGRKVSLSDLAGSFVYIDFWATWCAPCRREIPYLEELQNEFKDVPNIKLVSLSIDRNKSAWENMVADKDMSGLQWYVHPELQESLAKNYNISGIPRFIIIDPEGNIYDAHAPRPSSGQVGDLLHRLSTEA